MSIYTAASLELAHGGVCQCLKVICILVICGYKYQNFSFSFQNMNLNNGCPCSKRKEINEKHAGH